MGSIHKRSKRFPGGKLGFVRWCALTRNSWWGLLAVLPEVLAINGGQCKWGARCEICQARWRGFSPSPDLLMWGRSSVG